MNKTNLITVPGRRLCLVDKTHVSGHGTFEKQGYIYSTLAGVVDIVNKKINVIEVHSPGEQTLVPTQGDIVTAQVVIITQQMCKCLIKCIGNTILSRRYRGILRKEDIRAADKDRIDVYKSFRPGDVILARILPIIEAQTYKLSTAENELGVVTAYSEHGYPMVPISWTMMQCTKMYSKEHRKVAKITPEKMNFKDLKLS